MKKILVLTSGGDSSGMNAYLEALSFLCEKNEIELFASLYGFQGLVEGNFQQLFYENLKGIQNLGGSFINTSRSKDFVTQEGFDKSVKNIKQNDFDVVVIVGGNGSFCGANDLAKAGVNILAIPGTIDNDLFYTDKTLGYDTACQNALDAIIKIKQTMESSDRGTIVEVMGRHCPDIAIHSAILSNADMLITEKIDFSEILKNVENLIERGVKSPLIIVQENLLDVNELVSFLEENTKKEFRASVIGYVQRGGEPTADDKLFAIELACSTIKKILGGVYNYAIGKKDNVMVSEKIDDAVEEKYNENNTLRKIFEDYCKR